MSIDFNPASKPSKDVPFTEVSRDRVSAATIQFGSKTRVLLHVTTETFERLADGGTRGNKFTTRDVDVTDWVGAKLALSATYPEQGGKQFLAMEWPYDVKPAQILALTVDRKWANAALNATEN